MAETTPIHGFPLFESNEHADLVGVYNTAMREIDGLLLTQDVEAIASLQKQYYLSIAPDRPSGGEWGNVNPAWEDGTWVFERDVVTYITGDVAILPSEDGVCVTGPTGPKGERGEQGEEGPVGPTGEKGDTGAPGPVGPEGARGEQGDPGERGPAGPEGPRGPEGPQGVQGEQGERGPEGERGPKGDRGEQGPVGPALTFEKTYASKDAMDAAAAEDGVPEGAHVIIGGQDAPVEGEGDVYVKHEGAYVLVTHMRGAAGTPGARGPKGDSGTGVESATVEYAVAESSTEAPQDGWQAEVQEAPEGQYLWTRTTTNYTDGDPTVAYSVALQGKTGPTGPRGEAGEQGEAGTPGAQGPRGATGPGVTAGEATYASGDSGETAPVEVEWQAEPPQVSGGKWLWCRLKLSFDDPVGDVTVDIPVRQGKDGATGERGEAFSIAKTYKDEAAMNAAAESDGVPENSFVMLTDPDDPQAETNGSVYVKNGSGTYDFVVKMQGAKGDAGPAGPAGPTGAAGRGVLSAKVEYQAGESATEAPSSTWSATPVAVDAGKYLWTRTTTTYTSGQPTIAYAVSLQGATGPAGAAGPAGPAGAAGTAGAKGDTGPAGRGVTGATTVYAVGDSATAAPGSGWEATPPEASPGQYVWARTTTTYTSGSSTVAYNVALQGATGPAGPAGPQGARGPQGERGLTGETGPAGATGLQGPTGPAGSAGPQGPAGPGLVAGGTDGQALVKSGTTDYATKWTNVVPSANTLATARTFQTNLGIETAVAFNGSAANVHGVTGVLPVGHGGTGNTTGAAASLATARSFQTNLGLETAVNFNGTANNVHGVTGVLPTTHGGTGNNAANFAKLAGMIFSTPQAAGHANVADLNAITDPGVYTWNNASKNPPVASSYGVVLMLANTLTAGTTNSWSWQIGILTSGAMYVRLNINNATWGAWAPVYSSVSKVPVGSITGVLPVANGGTGNAAGTVAKLTTPRAFLTNLATTAAVNFDGSANNTHGVTGILPAANGGTGNAAGTVAKLTTPRAFQTNLALTTAVNFDGSANNTHGVTGVLGVANGGTGVTSLAALKTALGVSSKGVSLTYAEATDDGGTTTIKAGEVAGFSIIVANTSPATLTNFTLTEKVGDLDTGAYAKKISTSTPSRKAIAGGGPTNYGSVAANHMGMETIAAAPVATSNVSVSVSADNLPTESNSSLLKVTVSGTVNLESMSWDEIKKLSHRYAEYGLSNTSPGAKQLLGQTKKIGTSDTENVRLVDINVYDTVDGHKCGFVFMTSFSNGDPENWLISAQTSYENTYLAQYCGITPNYTGIQTIERKYSSSRGNNIPIVQFATSMGVAINLPYLKRPDTTQATVPARAFIPSVTELCNQKCGAPSYMNYFNGTIPEGTFFKYFETVQASDGGITNAHPSIIVAQGSYSSGAPYMTRSFPLQGGYGYTFYVDNTGTVKGSSGVYAGYFPICFCLG